MIPTVGGCTLSYLVYRDVHEFKPRSFHCSFHLHLTQSWVQIMFTKSLFRRVKLFNYLNCLLGVAIIERFIHKVAYFAIVIKVNGLLRNTFVVKIFFICFRSNAFSYKSRYFMLSVSLLKNHIKCRGPACLCSKPS